MRTLIPVALLTLAGMGLTSRTAGAAPAARPAGRVLVEHMLSIINSDRASNRLAPLRLGTALTSVALSHSLDMASHRYFSHFTLSGVSPYGRMQSADITYRVAGENLGYDWSGRPLSALRAINIAMLNSPEHRANLLRPTFRRVGIGIAISGRLVFVTEDFTG